MENFNELPLIFDHSLTDIQIHYLFEFIKKIVSIDYCDLNLELSPNGGYVVTYEDYLLVYYKSGKYNLINKITNVRLRGEMIDCLGRYMKKKILYQCKRDEHEHFFLQTQVRAIVKGSQINRPNRKIFISI